MSHPSYDEFIKLLADHSGMSCREVDDINNHMAEEDFIDFIEKLCNKYEIDAEKLLCNFPYTLYFKEGLARGLEQNFRRLFGMQYDKNFFAPQVPLTTKDLYELISKCPLKQSK